MMNIPEEKVQIVFILALVLLSGFLIMSAARTAILGEDEPFYKILAEDGMTEYYNFNFGRDDVPMIQPFLMTYLFSALFMLFGPSIALMKVVTAMFAIGTIFLVYLIGKRYSVWYGIASVGVLLSIASFCHYSLLAYLEIPIAFFSALVVYITLKYIPKFSEWKGVTKEHAILGIVLGLSYFVKVSGLLLTVSVAFYFILLYLTTKNKNYVQNLAVVLAFFSGMMIPYIIKNVLTYQYPFFEPLNPLFHYDSPIPLWITESMHLFSPVKLNIESFVAALGTIPFALLIMATPYLKNSEDKKFYLMLLAVFIVVFVLFFIFAHVTGFTVVDYRHLTLIYPQIALIGGFLLWKLKEHKEGLAAILIMIVLLGVITSYNVISQTSSQTRYSSAYIDSLEWVRDNTPQDSILFTTYIGSGMHYSERKVLWTLDELPEVMRASSANTIYASMTGHNISYILVWKPLLAHDYIVPSANLVGTFTFNFVDRVMADNRFELVFQNEETAVWRVNK